MTPTENCLTASLRDAFAGEARVDVPADVDWTDFVRLAREQGVLQWFATASHLDDRLPTPVRAAARQERVATAQRNLLLAAELHRLGAAMTTAGIEAIAFKGVVSAAQLVGDLSLRPSGDLDLLVHARDLDRATDVLARAGYVQSAAHPDAFQIELQNARTQTTVDLHWNIPPLRPPFDLRTLWRHRATVELLQARVTTVDRDAALALAAINCVKGYWNIALRQFVDLVVPLQRFSAADWAGLRTRCARIGCTRFLHAALLACERIFPNVLPAAIVRDCTADHVAATIAAEVCHHLFHRAMSAGTPRFFTSREDYEAAVDDRPLARQREWLKQKLTPNARDHAFLPLPKPLAPLYFVVRPVRLVADAIRGPAARSTQP